MIKFYRLLLLFILAFIIKDDVSAITYKYPNTITSFTGALNYCSNRGAQPLTLVFSTTTCGAGGNNNVAITVNWYTTSSPIPIQTVTSTAATTTFIYVPPTNVNGTVGYYATVTWAAIAATCVTGGTLTSATQTVTVSSCTPSRDMPDPPANLVTVPAGAYVIPMDNTHQNLWRGFPFNIKAYGLVDSLLLDDIPVYWVIKSGKLKDSADFSASVSQVYPTAGGPSVQSFAASEFIIDTTWLNKSYYAGEKTALQIITAFALRWKVAVYKLTSNTTVDIRYTLHQRPKLALFNNGTYQGVATKILDTAKFVNYTALSAGAFTGLADCYTFCTEMHWSTATLADSPTMAPVWQFIQEGGNFLGQCAGENTYENLMESPRHFHTTGGTVQHGTALPANYYSNPDMAFAQFQGAVAPRSGTTANWALSAGSSFDTETYNVVFSPSRDTIVASSRHYGNADSAGGNVFYIGGHDYMTSTATTTATDSIGDIRYINGTRMFLNACLIPANRPTAFALNPGTNATICSGDSVSLGGSPTGPVGSTYSWSPATGLSSATASNPKASPSVTTTYTVIAFDGSCQGGPNTVTVTVNPTPARPAPSSNSPICANATLNLSTAALAGATYSWTGPNSFSSALQNPSITNATTAATGTYSLTVTVGGCTSPIGTTTVTVNPTPATPSPTSNSPICANATLNLSTSAVGGATYSWTGPNTFSSALQNPSISNATIAATGIYSLTVSAGGCTSPIGTTTVTVNPTPATPVPTSNSPICAGSTLNLSTSAVGGATYNWTGPNTFSSALQNPSIANATVAAAGVYSLSETIGGCTSAIATTTVTVSPIPSTPTASSNSPICAGATLTLNTPTVAGATYSWTGPNTFISALQNPTIAGATVAATGIYSVSVSVGGCPSAVGTTTVTVNPTPATPAPTSNSPICAGSTLNLSVSAVGGATYNWTGPNTFSSSLQNPSIANATVAAAGTYSLTVTVAGCTSGLGTTGVTVNPTPATPSPTSNSPICTGSTLNLSTSAVGGATYNWTGPNTFSSGLQNPSITNATAAATGTYSLTVSVGGCTSLIGTTSVIVSPPPTTPAPSSNSPVCVGFPLNLTTATVAGATYSWTGPNTFSSALQNPTIASVTAAAGGTYSVTVTVGGCTSAIGTTFVTVNPTPATPAPTSNSPICAGSTLNLSTSAVGGATYNWTGPNTFSSGLQNPSISNATAAAAGTYSLTVSVGGCTSLIGTTSVTVNPIPATPSPNSNSPVCIGFPLNLTTSAVGGATYSWTGPNTFSSGLQNPTIASVTAAAAGTYSLTVTVSGCSSGPGITTVVVSSTPATPAPTSNSPICAGSALNLSTSAVGGATYNWTGPNTFSSALQNPTIANATVAAAGTYSLTVSVGGCTSLIGTTSVTINPSPATPSPTSNSPICVGSTLNLSTSAVGGATYSWTGPNTFSSALQNPSITNATVAASGTYSLTVTVGGCTSDTGTAVVVVNPPPSAPTASSNSPVCIGFPLNLTTPTVVGATYSWSGPNTFSSTLQNPTIASVTAAAAGTYSVTITVAGCGSTSPGTTTVVVNPTPTTPAPTSNSPICAGSTLNLNTSAVASATYNWTGPNTFSSALQNPSITNATVAATGTYSVTVTVNGCTSLPGTTSVTVNPIPAAPSPTSNSPICVGSTLSLNTSAVGGATYSWTGPNTFSSGLQNPSIAGATAAANGTYSLTVTVAGCTSGTGTTNVTVSPLPATPTASSNSPICANTALNLSTPTVAGATYSWTGPNTFSSNSQNPTIASAVVADAGTYSVTVSVGGCPSVAGTTTVVVNPAPAAPTATSNSPICSGSTLSLNASTIGGATYSWTGPNSFSSSTQNPTIPGATTVDAGTYSVTATVAGCASLPGTTVVVIDQPAIVSAGTNQTVCANNDSIQLNGTSTTTSGVWSTSGSGTFSPNNTTLTAIYIPSNADTLAGNVTLTLTSTNNGACGAVTDHITITITHAPTVNAGPNKTVCSNNDNVALSGSFTTATGAIWSTTGSGTFSPNNTTMTATYIPSNADTTAHHIFIILTSTGNGQCKVVTDTMEVFFTPAPKVEAGRDTNICLNNPDYQLHGSSSTTSGVWTTLGSGTFVPNNTTLNATYDPSTADTIAKTVTLILTSTANGGCNPVADSVTLTYTDVPKVNAGTNQTVCANNDDVFLNATSSTATGHWTTSGSGTFTPNANTLNATYTPGNADTTAGTVTLTFTSTNGCTPVSQSIIITITHAPTVNAGPDQSVCKNNVLTVTLNGQVGGGASTGHWTTSGSGTFSPNANTLNATYTPSTADTSAGQVNLILTSTGNGNCLAVSDTMTVHYTRPPIAEAGPNVIGCANNSIPLSGSITGGSGSGIWTTPNGTGTFVPNNTTLTCSYIPSNADTLVGNVILILTSTNNGGCLAASDSVIISVIPGPVVNAGPNQTVCKNNADVTLSGSITHATGGIWTSTGSGTFTPNNTSLHTTYIPSNADTAAGSVKLVLTSTGNGICLAVSDTMKVNFSPAPKVNAGADIFICTGTTSASLNGFVGGGASKGRWTTSGSGTFSPNDSTLNAIYNLSNADTTAHHVQLILTSIDNGGCSPVTDTVNIYITPIPTVNAGRDTTVCANNDNVVLNGIVGGGSGTGVWTTLGSGTFSPKDSVLNATYNPSNADTAAHSVKLVLTATYACLPVSDTVVISFTPAPKIGGSAGNQTICAGQVVNLTTSISIAGGGKWSTSGNGTFSLNDSALNVTYTPGNADTAAGNAILVLTTTHNGKCRAATDTIDLTIQSKPRADFKSTPVCVGNNVDFTDLSTVAHGSVSTWFWNFGNGTSTLQDPTNTYPAIGPQTVILAVATSAGCVDTLTKNIYVNSIPASMYGYNKYCSDSAMFVDKSSVNPGGILSWTWKFGDSATSNLQDPTHTYHSPGIYTVTLVVTSDSGCSGAYMDTVSVYDCKNNAYTPAVPTAFTPNGDGTNDILYVEGGPFSQMDFRVFDEWGTQVFQSSIQSHGWDGKVSGKPQAEGTFKWTLIGVTVNGKSIKMTGNVTLLR